MNENLTMPASEAIGKGLTAYQVVVALGAGLALLAGMWIMLFPLSGELIGSLGSGTVSLIKFGSAVTGLLSAAVGTVFFFFLKSLREWLTGVAQWTYGDNINSIQLDDTSSSIGRWLSAGQWLPTVFIGSIFVLLLFSPVQPIALVVAFTILSAGVFLFPAFGMVAFLTFLLASVFSFSSNTLILLEGVQNFGVLSNEVKQSLLQVSLIFAGLNIPLVVANWWGLQRVKSWVLGVTKQFTRRARGRWSLLELSKKLSVWFTAAQVLQGALALLLIYSLIVRGAIGSVLLLLTFNPMAGLYVAFIAVSPLVLYITTFLLLQWTRPFMQGVSYYIDTFLNKQQSA